MVGVTSPQKPIFIIKDQEIAFSLSTLTLSISEDIKFTFLFLEVSLITYVGSTRTSRNPTHIQELTLSLEKKKREGHAKDLNN